jgi:hypothetical protein
MKRCCCPRKTPTTAHCANRQIQFGESLNYFLKYFL